MDTWMMVDYDFDCDYDYDYDYVAPNGVRQTAFGRRSLWRFLPNGVRQVRNGVQQVRKRIP